MRRIRNSTAAKNRKRKIARKHIDRRVDKIARFLTAAVTENIESIISRRGVGSLLIKTFPVDTIVIEGTLE